MILQLPPTQCPTTHRHITRRENAHQSIIFTDLGVANIKHNCSTLLMMSSILNFLIGACQPWLWVITLQHYQITRGKSLYLPITRMVFTKYTEYAFSSLECHVKIISERKSVDFIIVLYCTFVQVNYKQCFISGKARENCINI